MFLSRNIEANRLRPVVPVNAGLSNESGSQTLLSKRFNTQKGPFKSDKQSLMRQTHEPLIESVIPLTTIDAAVEDYRLDRVDFVKIDTEGYEPFVVEGMTRTLERFDPFVYFEIHGLTPEQRLDDLRRVFRTLDPLGYIVLRLEPGLPRVTPERVADFTEGAFVAARVYTDALRSALRHWGES
jgi:FkbM family methyltransferase